MLDHISISCPPSQYPSLVTFYTLALAPLGYTKQMEIPSVAVGFGPEPGQHPFWIGCKENSSDATPAGVHLAFRAKDRATVEKFFEEAVKAGGKGNGEPGLREMYGKGYFAAFVLDLVGNNIEFVHRE
ncbi:hypothetical protein BCR34DRAFT_596148 [Clohesyomyces aquaticus]|uniref:VOC domain-containing protein n=1 Tax=Clohesyomyces aquaticus TaxID=1231657 RepID=A0A1Y2A7U6_9PLEO|nr:hypothetical protein BCR34DRAFT_596148 [Clohesyomyces aquaticus]